MLFILRQLRRLELRKRSGQYFVYAVGEVVLIVIGILIALQIQNWNENRLERIEEGYVLRELVDNLNEEADRLQQGLDGINQQAKSVEIIQGFYHDRSYTQEEFEANLGWYIGQFGFHPINSAYETMKATGLGFSNRQLKAELVHYYDRMHQVLLLSIETQRSFVTDEIRPLFLRHLKSFGVYRESAIPRDIEDPEFKDTILRQIVLYRNILIRNRDAIQNTLNKNQEILTLVEKELEDV